MINRVNGLASVRETVETIHASAEFRPLASQLLWNPASYMNHA